MKTLPRFVVLDVPRGMNLAGPLVRLDKIIHFVLGPAGTNISQCAEQWSRRMGVVHKSEFVFCATPEEAVERAREVIAPGVLPLFWTCAVYFRENELFFSNPDTLPFFISETMNLDEMQLAMRIKDAVAGTLVIRRVASHPSPAPLLRDNGWEIVEARSNAHAAEMCASGEVDACITTEQAKQRLGLASVHVFGSPPMVFFGGTTQHGVRVLMAE
jgi:prephenate dehydratase